MSWLSKHCLLTWKKKQYQKEKKNLYHKISKYKQKHLWNFSIGILRWFLRYNSLSLYSLINTNRKLLTVYTEGTKNEKKSNSMIMCNFYRWHWMLLIMPSMIFNLWPGDRPSRPPLPYFFFFVMLFFYITNSHPLPSISTEFNLPQQIQSPQHSVFQHSYSDSNFIEDSPL